MGTGKLVVAIPVEKAAAMEARVSTTNAAQSIEIDRVMGRSGFSSRFAQRHELSQAAAGNSEKRTRRKRERLTTEEYVNQAARISCRLAEPPTADGWTRGRTPLLSLSLVCVLLAAWSPVLAEEAPEASPYAGSLWSRSTLGGDVGGLRDWLAAQGLTVALDATYTFQGVVSGGFDGPLFARVSDEDDTGNDLSGTLALALDTGQAGLWPGGLVNARLEGRAGRSVLQRAGSVSAVDNDALFPNVVDRFDEATLAMTALTLTQAFGTQVSLFGGLLDTAEGDANELAGSALSNQHFLNSALLYSLVEDATVPNVSLGGGVGYEPHERVSGSFSIFGTAETAGRIPSTSCTVRPSRPSGP